MVWVRPCVHNLPFMSGNCTDIILKLFSPNRISNLLFLSGEGTSPIPLDLHCPFLFLHLHHLKNLSCIKLKEHYLTKEIDLIENQHKKRAFNTLIFWVHWCCSLEKWIIIPQQRDNCKRELSLCQAHGQRRWAKKRGGKVKGGLRGPTLLSSVFLSLLLFPTNWEVKKNILD